MTPQEHEYIRRAMEALEGSDITDTARAKILKTISQICGKCATEIEHKLVDYLDT